MQRIAVSGTSSPPFRLPEYLNPTYLVNKTNTPTDHHVYDQIFFSIAYSGFIPEL